LYTAFLLYLTYGFADVEGRRNVHLCDTYLLLPSSSVFIAVCSSTFLYNKTKQMHQFPKFTPAWISNCFGQYTRQNQDGTAFHPGPARKQSTKLHDIYQCRMYSE